MAAIAAAVTAASTAFSHFQLSKPSSLTRTHRCFRSFITSSLSPSSSSSREFNITFAPPKPKTLKPVPNSDAGSQELYIPWVVHDDNGNLTLQATTSARLLHAMADPKTSPSKKKKKKEISSRALTSEPKHSKAARRFYNENFRPPPQRLSKVLAAAGVASRRRSEELIFEGRVTVNGSVCNSPQTKVDPGRDSIYVNGNRLPKKLPPKVYLALNKPKGYICSSGEKETKPVISLFEDYLKSWDKKNPGQPRPRLFTVGRLDVATSGLIIVTNDAVDGVVNKRHLIAISEGTLIDGVHCTPDAVELLPQQPGISRPRLRIVVHEGRNHEVRELVKSAGLKIYSLKRVRIGAFRLPPDLGLGKHMVLKQSNLRALGWDT